MQNPNKQNLNYSFKNILRWLDPILVLLTLAAYFVYLNNRQGQLGFLLIGLVILVVMGGALRFGLSYPSLLRLNLLTTNLRSNWSVVLLVIAIILGSWLSWQAIKQAPPLTLNETRLTTNAVAIVKRSDWNTSTFNQPPLYLNLTALTYEGAFLQQLGKGQYGSPDNLRPDSFLDLARYLNLALALLTLIPLYVTTAYLYGRRAGAMAALLLATAWTHYSAVARLEPPTLAGALLMLSFYFGVRGYYSQAKSWNYLWAGLVAGLATAAAYGAVWLLPFLGLAWFAASYRTRGGVWQIGGGWWLGFTLGAVGWVWNLPSFINGLGSIGGSGDFGGSVVFYTKEFFKQDAGLALLLVVAFLMAILRPNLRDWLSLGFVVSYGLSLTLIGPNQYLRLDLLLPLAALAAARPLEMAAGYIQLKLNDGRHAWAGTTALIGVTLAIILTGVIIRRVG